MKLFSIAALAVALATALTSPSFALTALQVAQQVGGYTCSGNVCTLKVNGKLTGAPTAAHGGDHGGLGGCKPFTHQINGFKNTDGSPFCVMLESYQISGLSGTPGAVSKICDKTVAVIGFDPAGGLNGFSVTKTQSQSAGAC